MFYTIRGIINNEYSFRFRNHWRVLVCFDESMEIHLSRCINSAKRRDVCSHTYYIKLRLILDFRFSLLLLLETNKKEGVEWYRMVYISLLYFSKSFYNAHCVYSLCSRTNDSYISLIKTFPLIVLEKILKECSSGSEFIKQFEKKRDKRTRVSLFLLNTTSLVHFKDVFFSVK